MLRLLTDVEVTASRRISRTTLWRDRRAGVFIVPLNYGTDEAPRHRTPEDEIVAYDNAICAGLTREQAVEAAMAVRRANIEGAAA